MELFSFSWSSTAAIVEVPLQEKEGFGKARRKEIVVMQQYLPNNSRYKEVLKFCFLKDSLQKK